MDGAKTRATARVAVALAVLLVVAAAVGVAGHPADGHRLIAHRGLSVSVPENTVPAIVEAKRHGYQGVEVDVRATRDGVAVLSHDASIAAGGGAGAESIAGEDSSRVLGIVLADDAVHGQVRVATLEDALAAARGSGLEMVIHFKEKDAPFVGECVGKVVECGLGGGCIYNTDGDGGLAEAILAIDPGARFQFAYADLKEGGGQMGALQMDPGRIAAIVTVQDLDGQVAHDIREWGCLLYVYNVDDRTLQLAEDARPDYIEIAGGLERDR